MRAAEVVALEPGEHLDIEAGLVRIAVERRRPVAAIVLPLDLVRRLRGDGGRIEARIGAGRSRDRRVRGRAVAGDEIGTGLLLGAVPVHLEGVIDHEGALGQPHRAGGIDHRAGAFPSGAVDHSDDAVIGMDVRTAEAVRLELVDVDVERAGLLRIAVEHGAVGLDLVGRIGPHELVRRLEDDGLGVELGRLGRGREAQSRCAHGECKMKAGRSVGHFRLPDDFRRKES